MSRSALLDLLPDLSQGRPHQHPAREPGFEPLVLEANSHEEFSSLGMPAGFTAASADHAPEIDPFADPLSGFEDVSEQQPLDLPDIDIDAADLPGGLSAEEPIDILGEAAMDLGETDALPPADITPPAGGEEPAGGDVGIAAHELLEASHRADIAELEAAHRDEIDRLVSTAIPKIREDVTAAIAAELVPLLVNRIRADVVDKTLQALASEVTGLLEDNDAVRFELHGPQALLSGFMEKWNGDAASVKLVAGNSPDLVAHVDRTVIATRLSEVDRLFEEAMA